MQRTWADNLRPMVGIFACLALLILLWFGFSGESVSPGTQTDPVWTSLLPPLVAIGLALLVREVISSLLFGILVGSLLLTPGSPADAFIRIPTEMLVQSLADSAHAAIILFSLMLGGMVGILAKSGGMAGLVQVLSRLAKGRRGALIMTWLLGVIIFFDDYANTLLVGNTVRPYTDKLKISRAKLAYIVDSTAAPVASIAVISTWVGFQVGLIRDAAESLHLINDPYFLFLQSIPYSSYSWFTLAMVVAIAWLGRDLNPMRRVEHYALLGEDPSRENTGRDTLESESGSRHAAILAVTPVLLVIVATFAGLYLTGRAASADDASLAVILGASDSSSVLLAASFIGMLSAAFLAVILARKSISEVSSALLDGIRAMLPAMVILLLAWSIGDICGKLGTASFVVQVATGNLPPTLIPLVLFLVSGVVAFSTGTSWGAMAILIPIAIPIAHDLPLAAGWNEPAVFHVILGSIGAVLAGATFGDHCSPISDTTILSSMASGCNHIDHVRTQIPYAILSAGFAILFGYLPAGFGIHPFFGLFVGVAVMIVLVRLFPHTEQTSPPMPAPGRSERAVS